MERMTDTQPKVQGARQEVTMISLSIFKSIFCVQPWFDRNMCTCTCCPWWPQLRANARQRVFLEHWIKKKQPPCLCAHEGGKKSCEEDSSALPGSIYSIQLSAAAAASLNSWLRTGKLHDTCLSRMVSLRSPYLPPSAVRKREACPGSSVSMQFIYAASRSAPEPLALASSAAPLAGPLLSHQFTDTHARTHSRTHTGREREAGARSITPGRAHAHCAHCSAAAAVRWPPGAEPSSELWSKQAR